jgi:hypothetical protein
MAEADTLHQKLIRSYDVLLAGQGSLPLRVWSIASHVAAIPSSAFANERLRARYRRLADMFVLMGLLDDDLDLRALPITEDDAKAMATAFIDFCRAVAEVEMGNS